jgi:hypothetical protein
MQVLLLQNELVGQTLPHAPQFELSLDGSVHEPEQHSLGAPPPQTAPWASAVQAAVLVEGWQVWQASPGSIVAGG